MYHPVEIEKLSKSQISKLLNGHPVRVKHGKGHHIEVSGEQHKKLHKAHLKGSGCNLTFDPFQMHRHQHLRGEGFMDNVKNMGNRGVRLGTSYANKLGHEIVNHTGGGFLDVINDIGHKAGQAFSLGNSIPFNPYDLGYSLGHDVIAPAIMKGSGVHKHHSGRVGRPKGKKHGGDIWGDIRGTFESPAMQSVGKMLQPLAEKALNKGADMALNYAMSGEGLHRHRHMKTRAKTPKHKHAHGGAMAPAGYYY